jgi:hypothetical protein
VVAVLEGRLTADEQAEPRHSERFPETVTEIVKDYLTIIGPEELARLERTAHAAVQDLYSEAVTARWLAEGLQGDGAEEAARKQAVAEAEISRVSALLSAEGVRPGSTLAGEFPAAAAAVHDAYGAAEFEDYVRRRLDERVAAGELVPREEVDRLIREAVEAAQEEDRRREQDETSPKRRRRGTQQKIAQPTFAEVKALALALADGPTGRHWSPIEGEVALWHMGKEQAPLQVKLVGAPFSTWLGLPMSVDGLKEVLRRGGIPAILVQGICVQLAAESPRVTMSLDELLALLGWKPRTTAEREQMRAKVWQWMVLCEALLVIGARGGRWPDRLTKEVLDLTSRDPLIRIVGQRLPPQHAFEDGAVPTEVSWVAGEWMERFRGNRSVLSDFGDLRKLAAIPAGKVGGAWAQAAGLALHQLWREQSPYVEINLVSDDKRATAKFDGLSPRRLLTMFEPDPPLNKFIEQDNPRLIRKHFEEALKILKQRGLVASFDPPLAAESRQGWLDRYLDTPRDIRPSRASMMDAVIIKKRAKAVWKKTRRPKAAAAR